MSLPRRRALFVLFGFAGLAVAVISIADMFASRPWDGIVPYAYSRDGVLVREVVPDSPAARAGIRPNDLIVGIGRRMILSPLQASRQLLRFPIGSRVPYIIHRPGQTEEPTLNVVLSGRKLGDSTYYYKAVLGFLFFGIGLFVFWKRPGDNAASVFFVLCVLFLLFFVCRLRPSSYWWVDIFVQTTGTVSIFLLPATFLHFFLVFPRPKRFRFADPTNDPFAAEPSRFKRSFQQFLNGSPLLYVLIYAIPPVVFLFDLRREMAGRKMALLSGAPLASWVLLGDYLVLGLAALAHSAMTLEDADEKRQVSQVFFGTILGTAPFVLFGIVFPTLLHNDSDVFFGIVPMILIPLTFAYAIVRYQLLNVRFFVRRSLLYTSSTAILFSLYAGAIAAANLIFTNSRLSSSRLFVFGFLLVVVPLFEFARRRMQVPIDRLFFRQKYDYQNAVLEVSEAVAGELDLARVCDYLSSRLCTLLRVSGAEIFLRERDGQIVGRENREDRLRAEAVLARLLAGSSRLRDVSELATASWGDPESTELLQRMRDAGVRLLVPILYRGRLMGFLAVKTKLSEEDFDADDRMLLETLANQAATAIETAFLHDEMTQQAELKRDLEIARDIQTSLFPREFPKCHPLEFTGGSIPAREVGGDFYDFLPLDHGTGVGFVMGDVSGKSIPASLLMVASREILFAGSRKTSDPGELFRVSNRRIYEIKRKMFVALGYFVIDVSTLSMRYALGGQPLPLLLRPGDGGPRPIEAPQFCLPLGAFRDVPYDTKEVFLRSGDIVFFFTDGFTEAMDRGSNFFGDERLAETFARHASSDLDATAQGILGDVRRFVGDAEQYDDMTFILMRVGEV